MNNTHTPATTVDIANRLRTLADNSTATTTGQPPDPLAHAIWWNCHRSYETGTTNDHPTAIAQTAYRTIADLIEHGRIPDQPPPHSHQPAPPPRTPPHPPDNTHRHRATAQSESEAATP